MKKKLTIGPLGFPMPDALAHEADAALKAVPKEIRERFKTTVTDADGKSYDVEGYCRRTTVPKAMDFSDNEHADVSVITCDSVDRDNEVVLARGGNFSQFNKNPTVTFCHDYKDLGVGKCLWAKMVPVGEGHGWKAKTLYTPRPDAKLLPESSEWFPDVVWHYVREGFMPGKSIGFIPQSIRDFTDDEIRRDPTKSDADFAIDKWLMLEYAACPVQSNPDALVESVAKMKAKGIACKSLIDALGLVIPDSMPAIDEVETIVVDTPAPVEIKSYVRPDTIQHAAERRALESLKGLPGKVEARIVDRLYREMGKV